MSRAPLGVYSSLTPGAPGMGGRRSAQQKRIWLVWKHDDEYVIIQPINKNLVPIGRKQLIPLDEFKSDFTPEHEFIVEKEGEGTDKRSIWRAQSKEEEESQEVDWSALSDKEEKPSQENDAESLEHLDELFPGDESPSSAQKESKPFSLYLDDEDEGDKVSLDDEPLPEPIPEDEAPAAPVRRVAEMDLRREKLEQEYRRQVEAAENAEREARTAFGLGLSHLKRGNADRALKIFSDVANMDSAFTTDHKHMFNEFGISLRKNELLDLSLRHYFRALQISPGDENLHHNIARVYWEKGDLRNCALYLRKSLDLNPGMEYSQRFLNYLEKHKKRRKGRFSELLPMPHRGKSS